MGKYPDPVSGKNIPDLAFGLKIPKFFSCGSGSRIRDLVDPESGIRYVKNRTRDKHPESATPERTYANFLRPPFFLFRCDADPAALAKYVLALIKKDKTVAELKVRVFF
jgi:hypothetical protein